MNVGRLTTQIFRASVDGGVENGKPQRTYIRNKIGDVLKKAGAKVLIIKRLV